MENQFDPAYCRSILKTKPSSLVGGPAVDWFSELDPLADVSLSNMGLQQCLGGHAWAGVRRHPILHFALSGKGTFKGPHGISRIAPGQAFYMAQGATYHYRADEKDPWMYAWIELRGRRVSHWLEGSGIDLTHPVWQPSTPDTGKGSPATGTGIPRKLSALLRKLWDTLSEKQPRHSLHADLLLHEILIALMDGVPSWGTPSPRRGKSPVSRVLDFIHQHYSRDFKVTQLADHVGLHRSRLAALFKKETGNSIQHYLIRHRMDEACRLLAETDLSVAEVADSVGYPSYVAFAIRFKAKVKMSPLHWRERQRRIRGVSAKTS